MSNNDENNLSRVRRAREARAPKRKKKRYKIILLLFLFVFCFGGYTAYNFYKYVYLGYQKSASTVEVDPNFNHFSLLIMGIDENDSRAAEGQTRENSRTDSIVYLAVNKNQKRMDMVSIPRDSLTLMRKKENVLVNDAYFFDKITHAYAYGGVDATIEASSNLINAPVNFYAIVNFKVFEQVVDSLGGLNLYVPFDMLEQNANGDMETVELKKGWQLLNGEQALAFARSRYYDSDIERGQRQLQVIHAIIDKAQSLNALAKINDLIQIGGDNVTHNMTLQQIASAVTMFANNDIEIVSHRIGGYDAEMGGVYYYYPKPSHLQYISSVVNNTLEKPIPLANSILNIHYQGYIVPLNPKYNKNINKKVDMFYDPLYYVTFAPEDLRENLPQKLSVMDLEDDPTVSNENKPINENVLDKGNKGSQ